MLKLAFGSRYILVVEDDDTQRKLVCCVLEESELLIVECETADEALAVMERQGKHVAVLFTDVAVPGVRDGIDLAHEVAQRWPDTEIIVTSGRLPERALPGKAIFLPKPWRVRDLLVRQHARWQARRTPWRSSAQPLVRLALCARLPEAPRSSVPCRNPSL